jgi:hypothetical protein
MIWEKGKRRQHFVFNQNSLRIVYPPSHRFYLKPVRMAIKFYETSDWKMIDSDAWRGDKLDEYMEAMRKMYPKKLQPNTKRGKAPIVLLSKKDTGKDGLPDD